jgi:hypothetical protein
LISNGFGLSHTPITSRFENPYSSWVNLVNHNSFSNQTHDKSLVWGQNVGSEMCTCICFSLLYSSHFCYIVIVSFAPHYIIIIQRAGVPEPATNTFWGAGSSIEGCVDSGGNEFGIILSQALHWERERAFAKLPSKTSLRKQPTQPP